MKAICLFKTNAMIHKFYEFVTCFLDTVTVCNFTLFPQQEVVKLFPTLSLVEVALVICGAQYFCISPNCQFSLRDACFGPLHMHAIWRIV